MSRVGRKRSLSEKQSEEAKKMYLSGRSIKDILKSINISLASFYRYKSAWDLRTINIAVESTQGRYVKNYTNEEGCLSSIERFELALAQQMAFFLGYEVKFHPYSFKDIKRFLQTYPESLFNEKYVGTF
jgi:transposase